MSEYVLFRVGEPDPEHPHLTASDLDHLATLWGVTPEQVADGLVADGWYARPPENPAAIREPDLANPPVDAEYADVTGVSSDDQRLLEAPAAAPARGGA